MRVTEWMVVGLALVAAACASTGARPRPFPSPGGTNEATTPATVREPAGKRLSPSSVVESALTLRGVPYRNGGADPRGFDCSGFTQYVFGRLGLALPRDVHEQFRAGQRVDRRKLAPGDLVFFTTTSRGASHVAIAIDEDHFVHAPSSRGVVRVERLSAEYWRSRVVGVRRVIPR
jgi:cell wall-associated NlpC family hydrolase